LFACALLVAAVPCTGASPQSATELAAQSHAYEDPSSFPGKTVLTPEDEKFLDDLQHRGIQFFLDEADPVSGLMPDRARANGGKANDISSTASVGFGLTALCIGAERGWVERTDAYERCLKVIKFLYEKVPHERGHFFHFINMRTGAREWNSEVSNIDTAILMCGVITARQYFPDTELAQVATALYERVDWTWMLDEGNGLLHTGWKPERGMYEGHWGAYSECPVLISLIGMGSATHPLPAKSWTAWKREPVITYAGLTFIQCPPLFTHQFPQCWFDLRGLRDDTANYFKNAQLATIAQRDWMANELGKRFEHYGPNVWGLTASDYRDGYTAWGGPPAQGPIDGSVVPCAPAGSLAFEPRICLDALKEMKQRYGEKAYVKYGFVDAFNPKAGWYNKDVIGIDVGATVLMAENCRSAFVWKTFMSSPEAQRALKAAGLRPVDARDAGSSTTSVYKKTDARPSDAGTGDGGEK
jgi:hypothetical protein